MIIWILALVLFGCLAYAGLSLGGIRATFAFIGLLVGALLARLLGHRLDSLLGSVGLKNPVLIWLVGPLVVFLITLAVFKILGTVVHRKVGVHFKYKGDLRLSLWRRLNSRLGLCMGVANAAVYLILISLVIYILSYATVQMVAGDEAAWTVKLLNQAGHSLQSSGMAKVAAAVDPMPESYYQATDTIGLIYHNDLLESRLSHYPGLMTLGQRPEFQQIADDKAFTELRQRQPPITEIIHNDKMQSILSNPDLLHQMWATVLPILPDLQKFLLTGESDKYQEKLLGRWNFSMNRALRLLPQTRPKMSSIEMKQLRSFMSLIFAQTTMMATPEKQVYIKNVGKVQMVAMTNNPAARVPVMPGRPAPPAPRVPQIAGTENLQGDWASDGAKYQFNIQGHGTLEGTIDGDRLTITGYQFPMVFEKEY